MFGAAVIVCGELFMAFYASTCGLIDIVRPVQFSVCVFWTDVPFAKCERGIAALSRSLACLILQACLRMPCSLTGYHVSAYLLNVKYVKCGHIARCPWTDVDSVLFPLGRLLLERGWASAPVPPEQAGLHDACRNVRWDSFTRTVVSMST